MAEESELLVRFARTRDPVVREELARRFMPLVRRLAAAPPNEFREGRIDLELADHAGRIEIRVGPLVEGGAQRLLEEMELPGPLAGSLRGLANEIKVEPAGDGGERLVILVEDAR
jgi:hypothetical protein